MKGLLLPYIFLIIPVVTTIIKVVTPLYRVSCQSMLSPSTHQEVGTSTQEKVSLSTQRTQPMDYEDQIKAHDEAINHLWPEGKMRYSHLDKFQASIRAYRKKLYDHLKKTAPPIYRDRAIAYWSIGKVYFKGKNYPEAIHYFNQAVEAYQEIADNVFLYQDGMYLYRSLGESYQAIGENTIALHYFTKAAHLSVLAPFYEIGKCSMLCAKALYDAGDYEQSLEHATKSLYAYQEAGKTGGRVASDSEQAYAALLTGKVYHALDKPAQATLYAEEACKKYGKNQGKWAEASLWLGKSYYSLGCYATSLEAFQGVIDHYESHEEKADNHLAMAYYGMGKAKFRLQLYPQAYHYFNLSTHTFNDVKGSGPPHKEAMYAYKWLGRIYRAVDEFSHAIACYYQAHAIATYHLDATHLEIARLSTLCAETLYAMENYREAARYSKKSFISYKKKNRKCPDEEQALTALIAGKALYKLKQYALAITYLHAAREGYQSIFGNDSGKDGPASHWLGKSYRAIRNYSEAVFYFKHYLAAHKKKCSSPCNKITSTHMKIGIALHHASRYQEAIKHFRCAIKEAIRKAGEKSPLQIAYAYRWLGESYSKKGEHYGALYAFYQVLSYHKENKDSPAFIANTYFNIGKSYHGIGSYHQATQAFKSYITFHKSQKGNQALFDVALGYNWLGGNYYDMGAYQKSTDSFKNEVKYYNKISGIKLHHDMMEAHFNRGKSYYKMGAYKEAIKSFHAALSESNKSGRRGKVATIHNWLGGSYCAQGNTSKAMEHFHLELRQYQAYYGYPSFEAFIKSLRFIGIGICSYDDQSFFFPFYKR